MSGQQDDGNNQGSGNEEGKLSYPVHPIILERFKFKRFVEISDSKKEVGDFLETLLKKVVIVPVSSVNIPDGKIIVRCHGNAGFSILAEQAFIYGLDILQTVGKNKGVTEAFIYYCYNHETELVFIAEVMTKEDE